MARCRGSEEDLESEVAGLLLMFMTTHLFQFRFADTEQYWLITLTFFRTCGNTSLRASCSCDGSWILSNCRLITFGSFSSPSNGVASPTSAFRHFDTEIESPAEGYSANSPTSAVSSSCVVHCAENGSLFDLQACQPVQCNPMPAVRYISPMIQVGHVLQQNLCMDGCSDDGTASYDTSLSSSCFLDIEQVQTMAFGSFSSRSNGVASPTSAFTRHFDSEIDLAGSQGLEGMKVDTHCVIHVLSKELDEKRASLCTQTRDNPLLDVRVSSLSLLMKQKLHPRCERVTRRATTQRPFFDKGG